MDIRFCNPCQEFHAPEDWQISWHETYGRFRLYCRKRRKQKSERDRIYSHGPRSKRQEKSRSFSEMEALEEYIREAGILAGVVVWGMRNYTHYRPGINRQYVSATYFKIVKPWVEKDQPLVFEGDGPQEEFTFTRACTDILGLYPESVEPLRTLLIRSRAKDSNFGSLVGEFYDSLSHHDKFESSPWWRVITASKTEDYTEHEDFNYQMGDIEDFASERIGKYKHPRGRSPYKDGVARGRICAKTGKLLPKEKWPRG